MFSVHRKSTLISYSNGMFTRHSASPDRVNNNIQCDLIAFLSIVQKCNVDFLPIMWQPALGTLGEGGSGIISQSAVSTKAAGFAFKRFHASGDSEEYFLPLMSEVLILSRPPIQSHPNIINLEGICWEIQPKTQKAVPVLVFERAAWDLERFMNVGEGMSMLSFDDRLKICSDIGSAIAALHDYDVIHGDIKPQNVLVFKGATGKAVIKVTDFGYSTLAAGEGAEVILPKSRPWDAPEHRLGEFRVSEAKKMDVYSFGMLCLWVLFGSSLSKVQLEGVTGVVSFDVATGSRTSLERLKDGDKIQLIATQLMQATLGLCGVQENRLKEFFSLTVTRDPENRTSDIGELMSFLSQEPTELRNSAPGPLERTEELSMHTDFRIAIGLGDFVLTDYRVRAQIRDSLERSYFMNERQPFASRIAFQVAFCYQIGFGVKSDENQRNIWLEKSKGQLGDLATEKSAVREATWKNERLCELDNAGLLPRIDLTHEYRMWGLERLQEAQEMYEREVSDMAREFGELHFIPLALYRIIGELLDQSRDFGKSKALRMRIKSRLEETAEVSLSDYIRSMLDVASSHQAMGEWVESQALHEELLEKTKKVYMPQSLMVMLIESGLASMYAEQGRWKEAKELQMQVLEKGKEVWGLDHPNTSTMMGNLASIFLRQGRWKEAEKLEVQVIEVEKKVWGIEHPGTLTSISNLALIYGSQGQWKEAEKLQVQVMETRKRVLGFDHPKTLGSINNLALTYKNQGRWSEAKELQAPIVEIQKSLLGLEHPATLIVISNLALIYMEEARWGEAKELLRSVMETRKMILGLEHPDTLTSISGLAEIYKNQGRWKEAEDLEEQAMEMRTRVLGPEHPDTLTSISNLAETCRHRERWKEAEELGAQVMETRTRVLGSEHPDTLTSMSNLAATLYRKGRWQEAQELQVQTRKLQEMILDPEHPNTLTNMNNLAMTYENQGQSRKAEELLVHVMEVQKRVMGLRNSGTLVVIGNLAMIYKDHTRWKEGEELEVQVMETRKAVFGLDHLDTLTSMHDLASTFWRQGRLKEAEELQVQALEGRKGILGPDHPDTLSSMNDLALTFWRQERFKEAEVLQVQVVEVQKRILGLEHPKTLVVMGNLASVFWNQGRWKEAEELEVQVIETQMRVLGVEHLETLTSMSNLAATFWTQGRWQEAEKLQIQVTETKKKVLGLDHPHTLTAMHNLAATFWRQGRLEEAEELQAQALEKRKRILGLGHPDTLASTKNLDIIHKDRLEAAALRHYQSRRDSVVAITEYPEEFEDRPLQIATSNSLVDGGGSEDKSHLAPKIFHYSGGGDGLETDEERFQCVLAIFTQADDDNEIGGWMLRRAPTIPTKINENNNASEAGGLDRVTREMSPGVDDCEKSRSKAGRSFESVTVEAQRRD